MGKTAKGVDPTKLDDAKVVQILSKLDKAVPVAQIAAEFGVSAGTVNRINKGLSWKHIPRSGGKVKLANA
jgi:DNA invertase Pin-like site-specific DNA recombinase